MPLYEYKCSKCGLVFEVLQKVSSPPIKKCIQCGSPVQKIISPPALQFKGDGWYVTDYARKKKPEKVEKKEKKPDSEKKEPAKKEKSDPSSSAD